MCRNPVCRRAACRAERHADAGASLQPDRGHDDGRRWRWWPRAARRASAPPTPDTLRAVRAPTTRAREGRVSATARADPDHLGGHLEHVAGPHRRPELHVGVRREQALVAVGADAHLGGHVAEQAEAVGAVDEVAGVVGVGVGHVAAVGDASVRRAWSWSLMRPPPSLVVTSAVDEVADATSPGVVPRPKTRSTPSSRGHRLVEAGPADDQQRPPVGGIGLAERRRHLPGVEQVRVALGDDLGDQHGVGLLLAGPARRAAGTRTWAPRFTTLSSR